MATDSRTINNQSIINWLLNLDLSVTTQDAQKHMNFFLARIHLVSFVRF